MAKKMPYKIVYILGSAHCGSTLLDMALGTSKKAFSMGELAFYNHYLQKIPHKKIDAKRGFVCTCKKQVSDCPFWKSVKKAVGENGPIIKNRGHIETYKIFFNLLIPFKILHFPIRIGKNRKVLDAVFKTASKNKKGLVYLIDSSKDPRRLYELILDGNIPNRNILVLYLIRGGQAYLNSYKKDVSSISGVKNRSIFITLLEWLGVHIACQRLLRKYNIKYKVVKYHDFAKRPDEVLGKINAFLGLEDGRDIDEYIQTINRTRYHNLHGNFVKFKKFKKVEYDDSWKKNLTWFEKFISFLFLLPARKLNSFE